jgi:hypothetical protein
MSTGALTCTECKAETDATRGEAWHVEGGIKVHTIQPGEQLCLACAAKRPTASLAEIARRRELEIEREPGLLAIVDAADATVLCVTDDPRELLRAWDQDGLGEYGLVYRVPAGTGVDDKAPASCEEIELWEILDD